MIRSKRDYLRDAIRDAIADGAYPPGSRLPSEHALIKRYELSRSTVRKALGDLELAGLVTREQGRGSFVTDRAADLIREDRTTQRELLVSAVFNRHGMINPIIQALIRLLQQRTVGLARFALHYHERPHPERYPDADLILADGTHDLGWLPSGTPVIVINALHPTLPSLCTDNEAGGALTAQHLIDLGHRRIGIIRSVGDDRNLEFTRRHRAARRVFEQAGAEVHVVDLRLHAQHETPVEDLVAELLARSDGGMTALHCDTDLTAVRAIEVLGDHGLRVPEQVSVTGYDDQPTVDLITPPLTTVRQDLAAIADRLVEMLDLVRQGLPPDTSPPVWPRLIVRGSTLPPGG